VPGKVVGPSFARPKCPDVIEAVLDTYRNLRTGRETFIDTLRRVGPTLQGRRQRRAAPPRATAAGPLAHLMTMAAATDA
jgi:sulfite reductase (NADPH) hemoprotein beta-component